MQEPRERLLRRVEVEARAFANSDGTTSQLRLGRVEGLLEAGVLAGYWRKRDSAAAAELVQHRYRLSRLRDVLLRGDEVKLWKVKDIAEFLGVSTQRGRSLAGWRPSLCLNSCPRDHFNARGAAPQALLPAASVRFRPPLYPVMHLMGWVGRGPRCGRFVDSRPRLRATKRK